MARHWHRTRHNVKVELRGAAYRVCSNRLLGDAVIEFVFIPTSQVVVAPFLSLLLQAMTHMHFSAMSEELNRAASEIISAISDMPFPVSVSLVLWIMLIIISLLNFISLMRSSWRNWNKHTQRLK